MSSDSSASECAPNLTSSYDVYMYISLFSVYRIWKENSIVKKFSPTAAELYRSAFTLRQRMMNAIQNLEYYMMIEVIEPNSHIFIEKMKSVENVDMVLKLHNDFLDLCLKNCMLTETSHLNRAIFKLCKICLKFCEFIQVSWAWIMGILFVQSRLLYCILYLAYILSCLHVFLSFPMLDKILKLSTLEYYYI